MIPAAAAVAERMLDERRSTIAAMAAAFGLVVVVVSLVAFAVAVIAWRRAAAPTTASATGRSPWRSGRPRIARSRTSASSSRGPTLAGSPGEPPLDVEAELNKRLREG
jgi:hypothetical protein